MWQPLLREIAAADLIVVEHANKYLVNYLLLCCSVLGMKRVAYWGHGRNRQSQKIGISEWLKSKTLDRVDWWFAYTRGTADYLVEKGVSFAKITNVQNSIDTSEFRRQLLSVSESDLIAVREKLGISSKAMVGLFCGGITREKLPEFLIQSALMIKSQVPLFELIVIGDGPEKCVIDSAARTYTWIHSVGPQFGREKAVCFKLASLVLMPGVVGLAIVDAFAADLPIFTTDIPIHGPEIEYLENGHNGLITPANTELFASAIAGILADAKELQALKNGASQSAAHYSIAQMTRNFQYGINHVLRLAEVQ